MPTQEALTSSSEHVSDVGNTPALDTPTPIQTWEVPETELWEIIEGEPALMEAETAADNGGPAGPDADPTVGSKFGLAYREKDSVLGQWTTFAVFVVDPFNQISISDQMDDRGSERRVIEFDPRVIDEDTNSFTLDAGDEIALVTNCDDKIDPTATYFSYTRRVWSN